MSYKKSISRWLHKRISNLFLSARLEIPYNILLSTIIRDSGMTEYKQLRDSKKQIIVCLNEMIKIGGLDHYDVDDIFDEKKTNKIVDVKFLLYISECLFNDIQKGFLKNKELTYVDVINKDTIVENENIDNTNIKENLVEDGDNIKLDIISLLKSVDIDDKNINKILSSKKNQKNLDQVKINILTAKEYIENQRNNNISCNNLAIILSSIKNNWSGAEIKENINDDDILLNKEEQKNKNLIKAKEFIKNIENKLFKKISTNLLKNFGPEIYLVWLSKLSFVSI